MTDHEQHTTEGAEVVVAVVDEKGLALTDASLSDPLEVCYPPRPEGVDVSRSRRDLWFDFTELDASPRPRGVAGRLEE